jgi:hypothetical protein
LVGKYTGASASIVVVGAALLLLLRIPAIVNALST